MSSPFLLGEKNSTLSSAGPSHEASQSGHSGGRGTHSRASSTNQGGACEIGLRDGSAAVDRSEKAHASKIVKVLPLKTDMIPGSHEKFNSSIIFRTLIRQYVERAAVSHFRVGTSQGKL